MRVITFKSTAVDRFFKSLYNIIIGATLHAKFVNEFI